LNGQALWSVWCEHEDWPQGLARKAKGTEASCALARYWYQQPATPATRSAMASPLSVTETGDAAKAEFQQTGVSAQAAAAKSQIQAELAAAQPSTTRPLRKAAATRPPARCRKRRLCIKQVWPPHT